MSEPESAGRADIPMDPMRELRSAMADAMTDEVNRAASAYSQEPDDRDAVSQVPATLEDDAGDAAGRRYCAALVAAIQEFQEDVPAALSVIGRNTHCTGEEIQIQRVAYRRGAVVLDGVHGDDLAARIIVPAMGATLALRIAPRDERETTGRRIALTEA